jgi:hypothetical protein
MIVMAFALFFAVVMVGLAGGRGNDVDYPTAPKKAKKSWLKEMLQ